MDYYWAASQLRFKDDVSQALVLCQEATDLLSLLLSNNWLYCWTETLYYRLKVLQPKAYFNKNINVFSENALKVLRVNVLIMQNFLCQCYIVIYCIDWLLLEDVKAVFYRYILCMSYY